MRFVFQNPFVVPESLIPIEIQASATAISKISNIQTPPLNQLFKFSKQLQEHLSGKKLLLEELPFPLELIHLHYENGYLTYEKGITTEGKSNMCQRCGSHEKYQFVAHDCAKCHEQCIYCRHCITMGKISQCTPLLTWSGPKFNYPKSDRVLHWEGQLSPGQLQASAKTIASVGSPKQVLIWAVCGSGKTEILFEGMNKSLELGQNVLIATPRSDVVHELSPRMKKVFPEVSVVSLFGGSEDRGKLGQLVIATTHQLLRYDNHFDFVVIDEVDAFPFSFDPMLKYAVKEAAKMDATTILLTATPDKIMQKKVKKGSLDAVKIPKRYHGFPLPEPTVCWSGNWRKKIKKKQIPSVLTKWLENLSQQAFIFVPSVAVLTEILPLLQKKFTNIDGVHAEDTNRREKVQKFRDGEIQILVTTTILERGVTVANVAVAVLGADDDVFTESALVQIAGRVGRSSEFPSGEIIFFHYGKTEAMLDAVDHIRDMNKLGGF
jgi:competence protein ComFA